MMMCEFYWWGPEVERKLLNIKVNVEQFQKLIVSLIKFIRVREKGSRNLFFHPQWVCFLFDSDTVGIILVFVWQV